MLDSIIGAVAISAGTFLSYSGAPAKYLPESTTIPSPQEIPTPTEKPIRMKDSFIIPRKYTFVETDEQENSLFHKHYLNSRRN